MNIIKQNLEVMENTDALKHIEKVARTCYKSENMIKDGSALKFVKGLTKAKHYAMLEHAVFTFIVETKYYKKYFPCFEENIGHNLFKQFAKVTAPCDINYFCDAYVVSLNLRTIFEIMDIGNKSFTIIMQKVLPTDVLNIYGLKPIELEKDDKVFIANKEKAETLFKFCPCEFDKHDFITFKLTTNRAIANEIVRHRLCSFAQESTRYCNYSKDKYSNEIKVIEPCKQIRENQTLYNIWRTQIRQSEIAYFELLDNGATTDTARGVLPLDLATELIVTANKDELKHMYNLRVLGTTGKPHEQVKELLTPLSKEI